MSGETSELRLYLRRLLAGGSRPSTAELPPNFGCFEFKRYLGKGAMGAVFLAYRQDLKRYSAVKLLCDGDHWKQQSQFADDRTQLIQGLWEQAQIQSSEHPNVVLVYDVHETDDGVPVVEMQYVRGKTLLELVSERPRLSAGETTEILLQILRALQDRHGRGFVHGDLSLRNVMRSDDEHTIKVLDFAGERGKGTPCFSAPEQRRGTSAATPAVDVFAVGALGYTLLTGERLDVDFHGLTWTQKLRIPESLRSVIAGCLEVAPADRYQNPEAVIAALERRQRQAWRGHLLRAALSSALIVFIVMMSWVVLRVDLLRRDMEAVAREDVPRQCATLTRRVLGVDDYPFVYQRGLVACFHPWRRELVGTQLVPGQQEYPVVKRLWESAEDGLGLVIYFWEKPSLVGWLPEGAVIPKLGWAVYVPKHDLMVGSGWYADDLLKWTLALASMRLGWRKRRARRASAAAPHGRLPQPAWFLASTCGAASVRSSSRRRTR